MSNREIVYVKFLDCCKYTEDSFWKSVFEDLAYGITPYGMYISKDFICCNFKNKEFSYKIDLDKSSKELFTEIHNIFKDKFGLLSTQEKITERESFEEIKNKLKRNKQNWSNIRKKNVKDNIIEKFLLRMKEKHDLNYKQIRHLLKIINISITFKVITTNDIIYKDSKIESINGFKFKNKAIEINKNIYCNNNIELIKQQQDENKALYKNWLKLISQLNE